MPGLPFEMDDHGEAGVAQQAQALCGIREQLQVAVCIHDALDLCQSRQSRRNVTTAHMWSSAHQPIRCCLPRPPPDPPSRAWW